MLARSCTAAVSLFGDQGSATRTPRRTVGSEKEAVVKAVLEPPKKWIGLVITQDGSGKPHMISTWILMICSPRIWNLSSKFCPAGRGSIGSSEYSQLVAITRLCDQTGGQYEEDLEPSWAGADMPVPGGE